MKRIKYILYFLTLAISANSQNTMLQALDLGYKASSFTFTNTQNTINFTNDFEGQSSNDVFYKFTLTRAMDIVISHCGSELDDTYLHLLDANGNQIDENDDYSGAGGCSNMYNSYLKKINLTIGTYYVVTEGYSDDGNITTTIQGIRPAEVTSQNGGLDPSTGENYILTVTPTIASTDASTLTTDQSLQTIQYFDGLGRSTEIVQRNITPNKSDLISLTQYDGLGRTDKQWLSIPVADNQGASVEIGNLTNTSSGFYSDSKAYNQTRYEASPLNRVTGQYGAGAAWYAGKWNDSILYQTNIANEVAYFYVNSSNKLVRNSYYDANTLYKTVLADEDRKTTTEYKDKLGQVVMKRSSSNMDTYYVYNDLGQLCYVLPPMAADALTSGTFDDNLTPALVQYAYLYKYDERGNNVVKRLPGCDSICMVYDKTDRLVLSQDGNQRRTTYHPKQWTVNKYDMLGRVLYTGILNSTSSRLDFKAIVDGQVITEIYDPIHTFYSTGYTCTGSLTGIIPLTVNYYDDYRFRKIQTNIDTTKLRYTNLTGYDIQYSNARGLLTGTRTYILDNSNTYTTTALYYDDRGRVIQSRSSNHLGGFDFVYNHYDFTGNILKIKKDHNLASQPTFITEIYRNEYDPAGRLTKTRYKLGTNDTITLVINSYDELGRLTTKLRHNSTDTESYTYNLRNWTTKITSGTFIEELFYNTTSLSNVTPCFNGNIAASTWTYNGIKKAYTYTYDPLNRLTLATGYQTSGNTLYAPNNMEQFIFDKHGNIIYLIRQKDYSYIDFVYTTYNGNQVKTANDYYGSQNQYATKEYNNKSNTSDEFSYDKNGNMIKDLDRDIVTIKYNILNLPDIIQFKNGNQIISKYDASGRKLSTRYFTLLYTLDAPITAGNICDWYYDLDIIDENGTFYVDNFMYSYCGCDPDVYVIKRVDNPEGYMAYDFGGKFMYNRKDHLGNIREVWRSDIKSTIQRTQYYPSGLPWAESYNASLQPFKYNGKEFVEMHGYDEYDSEARWYYPAIMRTITFDPLAEKYYNISPYVWCGDNPLRFIDPTGMDTLNIIKNANGLWTINSFTQAKGNDVFNVKYDDKTIKYTFQSSDEYGERVNILNLLNNDDYTLGVYNIQGAEYGHGYGYVITPGGDGSTKTGSGKRLPADLWTLGASSETNKWRQVWVMNGKNNGEASGRGIKVHFGYSNPASWTEGCFILSFDYTKSGNTIKFKESDTRQALMWFDFNLGASDVYKYDKNKYNGHGRMGAHFPNGIKYKLRVYDGF